MLADLFSFPKTDKQATIDLRIGDSLNLVKQMRDDNEWVDAIICDPPYEIGYMAKRWDKTGIAFATETWELFSSVLKPGGYILAFAAARMYHHLAVAIENAGFETYPMLTWNYSNGLPKPMNVSHLFDRDNLPDRQPIAMKRGSGYNTAHVKYGRQNYSKLNFPVYAKDVSEEAQEWTGHLYGVNTLKPGFDCIYMGRKPVATKRVIDNLRQYGVGALNVGALRARRGGRYPSNVFHHEKTRSTEHHTSHPTVKPIPLMEDLALLCCPTGGRILDPFCGTGTTGVACRNLGIDCILIEIDPALESVIHTRVA